MNPLVIAMLLRYGHLLNPFGKKRDLPKPLDQLTLADDIVVEAIASFQRFHSYTLEPIVAAFEPQKASPAVPNDGRLDRATERLLTMPRCDCPDHGSKMQFHTGDGAELALGRGNWAKCNGAESHHRAVLKFLNEPPAFLTPIWSEIWANVVESYAEIGLELIRDDSAVRSNIEVSFVRPDGGWIGLAIVGNGVTCGDTIWARFDQAYRPGNLLNEWTTLIRHELGHNCGLQHSSGGVMNPYIIAGLPTSWRSDPSHPLLVQRFGGERIPTSSPPDRELVLAWRDRKTGTFELASVIPEQPGVWPT